ncbi:MULTISPECIES: VOC family protein [unclassified Bradyrhizobium]|uniref:VOC family protein n=1 Tax=unclassified Bradyrhizobium TaxID=2631580 RepID=UPI0028F0EBE2|nr:MULTISPECIES: VOC family protein [unclassified Bradyrhizobium]
MYDHVGLRVNDLEASVRFYTSVLAPLGHVLCSKDETSAGFGPKGAPALWLHLTRAERHGGAHVAFRAPDHAAVSKFHSEGLKAGGADNGTAGPRPDYSPTYYAAFLIDLDGNNIEAVCV